MRRMEVGLLLLEFGEEGTGACDVKTCHVQNGVRWAALLNHLISPRQQRRRHGEAEGAGGAEVDH